VLAEQTTTRSKPHIASVRDELDAVAFGVEQEGGAGITAR
jgi:hypothetical protein